jgi:hypothetical protein
VQDGDVEAHSQAVASSRLRQRVADPGARNADVGDVGARKIDRQEPGDRFLGKARPTPTPVLSPRIRIDGPLFERMRRSKRWLRAARDRARAVPRRKAASSINTPDTSSMGSR